MCGRLNKAMYGTRDAAKNWEYEYVEWLMSIGFVSGRASPCVFYHAVKGLRLMVHGDDFTILGYEQDLDWFRRQISDKYEVKFRGRIGPDANDEKSIRILNRVVEWTENGLRNEADQRHADLIAKKLGFEDGSNSVVTPGEKREVKEEEGEEQELRGADATLFRALVARANYLAQDRTDIAFAVKELCRRMSCPREGDWKGLKRLGRYLVDKRRLICEFKYQYKPAKVVVWVDTDHAGCKETRKSTSGGLIKLGDHAFKGWSVTQGVIALSSGEAEFYGIVKGSSVGMGIQSVLGDMGFKLKLQVLIDSSAAKGIASRRGLGKVRHIEVHQLWVQEKVADGSIELNKVSGKANLADALAKHVGRQILERHFEATNQMLIEGRHALMPHVG